MHDQQRLDQRGIHTDFGAIFVSVELICSDRGWGNA
ncbi:hypothetical protein AFEL58S_00326 [Afipia felis]|jgi:hypothetical protein